MTKHSEKRSLYIPYAGPTLLEMPLLNKGNAFDADERVAFNLIGLLPQNVETIEEQVERAYRQYQSCTNDLDKHIYLRGIQDDNETMFFRLLEEHLEEMMPIIYTPTVGRACEKFSEIYRNHRGIFVSYPDRHRIDDIVRSATKDNVKVIVVTDGERILGLGDQGIGGMGIPIGKLSLYTACGGISPAYTLPVVLDVGTNNQDLLDDPMYMGWRHERISDAEYAEFVDLFVQAIKRRWPGVLLQFEDFAQANAMPLLKRYRDQLCCFNDDIQGTAAVVVGSLLAACKAKKESIADQTIAFVGAGSAGCGIAEQIVVAMTAAGLEESEARARIYMIDRDGLITDAMSGLYDFQNRLAQRQSKVDGWNDSTETDPLLTVIDNAKPTVLIGVSGQRGLFSQQVIETMHRHCAHPLVMPLSNPTWKVEATPQEILDWTDGEALVATGSPFDPATVGDEKRPIAQCNNAYIFPGIGLGVIATGAGRVTDAMLMAASQALAESSPLGTTGEGALLPPLSEVRELSQSIAFAVAKQAQADGVALKSSDDTITERVERHFWYPRYRRYRRAAF
ncbi:NAD-dependent malic enzyme protein [Salinisphaera shabanensis E1L3A]|jgi:malate dehydrogenase (oxaloacetate-decarboxylating)|uniref:malate dehydrogenase (oxaloacetate-decarboxylating) n=1 Tax=Salinisphaera shabanensis E1L3A TaxID=1033802 RepID=F7Q3Q5_9GAMM|nr:NAD-dependent malic enzyme [Salinisphaera shabanensis]ERJ18403.1 NAD-dependent malic enzyme protein [Salinisphaera shabanensis E1L3A]